MMNIDYRKIITDSLIDHNFTIKATIIAALNLTLPLIWPILGITALMIIDLWTAYNANKKYGVPFKSKGLGKTGEKWINFLIGVIVVVIVDTLCSYYEVIPAMILTNIYITLSALRELKSISENFSGLGLARIIKVITKYITTKKIDLYEIIDEELKDKESKVQQENKVKHEQDNKTDL